MAQERAGNTALGAAICRLIEQYQPEEERLFNDPVIKDLLSTPIRMLMQFSSMRKYTIKQTDAIMPGIYGAQVCRTRFIDDAVQSALSEGVGQLMILGAGLDTRPYRLTDMARVKVFEVDLPSVQENKKKKLQKHFGSLPDHVSFIPIDFDKQSLETALTGTAFDLSSPAVYIWEGVTQYLTEEAVRRTLTFIGTSAPGSMLLLTYVLRSVIEGRSGLPGADKLLDTVAKQNAPWRFGLESSEIPSFLKPFHLNLVEDVGNADYHTRYLKPRGRNLVVTEAERMVRATVIRPS